jgi:hypothetical protein
MLPQVVDVSGKHMEWRMYGIAMSNLTETSGRNVKSFMNIYYINLSYFFIFLTVYPCLAFKK